MQLAILLSLSFVFGVVEEDEALRFTDRQHQLDRTQGVSRVIDTVLPMHDFVCILPELLHQPLSISVDGSYRRLDLKFCELGDHTRTPIDHHELLGSVLFPELCQRSGAHIEDMNVLCLQSIDVNRDMLLDRLIGIESLAEALRPFTRQSQTRFSRTVSPPGVQLIGSSAAPVF
jgi:hypothetical protein